MMWILLCGLAAAGVPTKLDPDKERGEELYMRNCWQCHGATGQGDGPLAAALGANLVPLAGTIPSDEYDRAIRVVRTGRGDMPAFSDVLDKHDARRILVWLDALDDAPEDADEDPDEADGAKDDADGDPAEGPDAAEGETEPDAD